MFFFTPVFLTQLQVLLNFHIYIFFSSSDIALEHHLAVTDSYFTFRKLFTRCNLVSQEINGKISTYQFRIWSLMVIMAV